MTKPKTLEQFRADKERAACTGTAQAGASGEQVVSRTHRSHFGSDVCFLPPFARRIFPLFPSNPACFFRILGQKWVRGCNIRRGLVRCNPALQSTRSILIPQMA